jgi:hypothetical protein
MSTPTQPNEAHFALLDAICVAQNNNRTEAAQVIADSEARAVERATAQLRSKLAAMSIIAEKWEAECLEQARLLGMSASREASLLGKISQLERQLDATKAHT